MKNAARTIMGHGRRVVNVGLSGLIGSPVEIEVSEVARNAVDCAKHGADYGIQITVYLKDKFAGAARKHIRRYGNGGSN